MWRDLDIIKAKKLDEPLLLKENLLDFIPVREGEEPKTKIILEFLRHTGSIDELGEEDREKVTTRKLLIGNCKLEDAKNEKNGAYELIPPAGSDINYFSCDAPKGAVNSGQETIVEMKFTPPEIPA